MLRIDTEFRDTLFPTDNDLEIPTLCMDMQANTCDAPFVCFGEQRRTYNMKNQGTLHFYTDDYKFSSIDKHPEKILAHHPRSIVEPNYTLSNETPMSIGLSVIHKKRWIARALQEKGIRVFVDLNVANKFIYVNLLGVPKGWSSFCTRGYSERMENLRIEYEMAKQIANRNPLTFVIYGGGILVRDFAKQNGCVYVNPIITMKKLQKKEQQLLDAVSFFSKDELKTLLTDRNLTHLQQVENYR